MIGESCIVGKYAFVLPSALGNFSTVQSVLDSMPVGGKVFLMDDIDLVRHNDKQPLVNDHALNIVGSGWGKLSNGWYVGTKIYNDESFDDCVQMVGNYRGGSLKDIVIGHFGKGAGIKLYGVIYPELESIYMYLGRIGRIGVDVVDGPISTFFIGANKLYIRDYVDYGIRDIGRGTQNHWNKIHLIDSATDGEGVGALICGSDKHIEGGEYSAHGQDHTRRGIVYEPHPTEPRSSGNSIRDFVFEGDGIDACITFGSGGKPVIKDAVADNIKVQAVHGCTLFRFKNAKGCHVRSYTNYGGSESRNYEVFDFDDDSTCNVIDVSDAAQIGLPSTSKQEVSFGGGGYGNKVNFLNAVSAAELSYIHDRLPKSVYVKNG